jgi:hypothetical protein
MSELTQALNSPILSIIFYLAKFLALVLVDPKTAHDLLDKIHALPIVLLLILIILILLNLK